MVPPGEQGADYRTLFRRSCDQPEVGEGCDSLVSPSILKQNQYDKIYMGHPGSY